MTNFVLVHGAFRGPWAWDRVRGLLETHGHNVVASDLTDPAATLTSYIETIVADVGQNEGDVVLVGHSQGGIFTRAATNIVASQIERLVFLDAPDPHDGEKGFDFRPAGSPAPEFAADHVIDPFPVRADEHLSEVDANWINARLVPQPVAPSMEPVRLDNPDARAVATTYAFFTETPPVFPCTITRQRLDEAELGYSLIEGPHDAIVSTPNAVAELLMSVS